MKPKNLLLLALAGAFLAAPVSFAMADPWKVESGHGRRGRDWDRRDERRWSERERRDERRWRHEQRERRAYHEQRRAYEAGRADSYREAAPRNPVEALGLFLRR